MLAGGVAATTIWGLLKALDEVGLPGQRAMHDFLDGWHCPWHAQSGSRDVGKVARFFDTRSREENTKRDGLRCSASELLCVARALEEFVYTQVPDDARVRGHREFFLAARRTVDKLICVKNGMAGCRQTGNDIENLSREQMAKAIEALGAGSITPKFHWSFDIAEQMRSSDVLVDAFVIERLHLRARDIADRAVWRRS